MLALALGIAGAACGGGRALPDRVDDSSGVPARLELMAPGECGTREELARAVEARVGRAPFVGDAGVIVDVRVEPAAIGWRAEVTTRAGERVLGRREIEEPSPSCAALWESLAFVVALVIDAPTLRPSLQRADASAGDEAEPTEVTLGVLGRGAVGRAPFWSGGLGAFVLVDVGGFVPIRVDALAFLPGREEADGRAFEAWAVDAAISVCPHVEADALRLELCGGLAGGLVHARGSGFDVDEEALGGTLDVEVWARPGLRLDRVVLSLGVGAGVALLRPGLVRVGTTGALGSVYEPSLFWGQLEAAVGIAID